MLLAFESYLRLERRYSPHTCKSYLSDLEQLAAWLLATYELPVLHDATRPMLRTWLAELHSVGSTPRTLKRKLSSLRAYLRWMRKYHGLQTDPTLGIQLPETPKRLPVFVPESHMQLLTDPHFFPKTIEGIRDRAMVELLYHTGMRSAELLGLKTIDVDLQLQTLRVLGKRNKERIVPVGKAMAQLLQTYIDAKSALGSGQIVNEFLFVTAKGQKMYPRLVYNVVNNYLSKVSSLQKKSPHVLRHTFATHMLNRGAELNAIKEILGHASLAATQVYTHNDIEQLKQIHRKAHPKG